MANVINLLFLLLLLKHNSKTLKHLSLTSFIGNRSNELLSPIISIIEINKQLIEC
jgi:hypothetical protein